MGRIKGKTHHVWDTAERNKLAEGVRMQLRDDKGGRPKWKKILEEDYFKPTLKEGELPLTDEQIRRQYERMGGENYVITWEKKMAPRRPYWMAPTPRYSPIPIPTRPAFHRTLQQQRDDAAREEVDAAREAQPRETGWGIWAHRSKSLPRRSF